MFFVIALLALFTFLTWRNLETGVLLLCALLPSYLIRFSIGGIPTTFLEMMALIIIGIWAIKTNWKIEFQTLKKNPLIIATDLLLIAATIGIFVSPDKLAAIGVWKSFYIEPILMFFVIHDLLARSFDSVSSNSTPLKMTQENIFRAFGISAFFVSLFGLVQYFFSIGIPAPWNLERRITSIFEYPNALALFLEPIIVISWFALANPPSFIKEGVRGWSSAFGYRMFWLTVSTLSTLNVFLAQSEAGIATLVVTALCILIFSRTTRKQTLISIVLASIFLFAIPTSRNYLYEKFTFQDSSQQVRLSQWRETIELLKDHPIMGVGLSGYPIALTQYHHDLQYEIFQYPHNIILNIWVELGILGLVAFGYLVFGIWKLVWTTKKQLPHHPLHNSVTSSLFFFVFLQIFLHSLVDVPYFKNDLAMMTWILIACAIALRTNKKYVAV